MRTYATTQTVPYSAEAMFDLAADVEGYPAFLRGWRAARVVRRDASGTRYVEQIVGLGPLRWRFTSHARGERPSHLHIISRERPFQIMQIDWRFEPAPAGGCHVDFEAKLALRSETIERLASDFLDASFGEIVSAFERRARELYGAP